MANLTYLGDACVLWNSQIRYVNQLIYTYSGLFCIAINPYKRFPMYTRRTMEIYLGKRRSECPPHIFAVGRTFGTPLAKIDLHGTEGVDGEALVGIDGDTEETGVGIDELVDVPNLGVPQDASISQVGEVSHVLGTVKLGRVNLGELFIFEYLHLTVNLDFGFSSGRLDQKTSEVSSGGFVGNPVRLFGVMVLFLQLFLQFIGDTEPWGWIGIGSGGFLDVSGHVSI